MDFLPQFQRRLAFLDPVLTGKSSAQVWVVTFDACAEERWRHFRRHLSRKQRSRSSLQMWGFYFLLTFGFLITDDELMENSEENLLLHGVCLHSSWTKADLNTDGETQKNPHFLSEPHGFPLGHAPFRDQLTLMIPLIPDSDRFSFHSEGNHGAVPQTNPSSSHRYGNKRLFFQTIRRKWNNSTACLSVCLCLSSKLTRSEETLLVFSPKNTRRLFIFLHPHKVQIVWAPHLCFIREASKNVCFFCCWI